EPLRLLQHVERGRKGEQGETAQRFDIRHTPATAWRETPGGVQTRCSACDSDGNETPLTGSRRLHGQFRLAPEEIALTGADETLNVNLRILRVAPAELRHQPM